METKKCIQCNAVFSKPINESKKNWNERHKFCSRDCVNIFQKGKTPTTPFKKGNIPWNKGKIHTAIVGENNHTWKGDGVGYHSLHRWVYRHKGRPSKCEHCGTTENRKYHWANLSGDYIRNLDDWIRLCVPCHSSLDRSNA